MTNFKDVYGEALTEFHQNGELKNSLLLHSSYGDIEEMPVEVFFREEEEFPELEFIALSLCDGSVLDVGAGVGSHALYLQNKGFNVTALEISNAACNIMKERGIEKIKQQDFYHLKDAKYDTILFLMNGIGLAESIEGFRSLLSHAKTLLTGKGQLLFDSSNISYLYDEYHIQRPTHYFGEIEFQYEFNGVKGRPFKWLYLDQETLIKIAHEESWVVQVLFEDEDDQYLVRMEPRQQKSINEVEA